MAHEWSEPLYIVKIDIAKAFDTVLQEGLGELIHRRVGREGGSPYGRPGGGCSSSRQPRSPSTWKVSKSPSRSRTGCDRGAPTATSCSQPRSGRRWGPQPKTSPSNISMDPTTFPIGAKTVSVHGPEEPLIVLGAPVNMSGTVAPVLAELQGRARRAFQAHKSVLCARTPIKERLQMHRALVQSAALWGAPAWPVNQSLLQAANTVQLQQVRTTPEGPGSPSRSGRPVHSAKQG